jgi:hypothetical protein
MTWKHGFKEDQHMYKKHGRDREANIELTVKALVAKALEEQGLSSEPMTVMAPLGELALVGSPPDVPSSKGSTAATTLADRIREPTSCTLVVLIGRQNTMMEVAKGVAHPLGGLHHNNKIPSDYTRVEVHSVKPEFMQWKIDHPTPEGLTLFREVMNQFILWHKRDIVLIASSPPVQHLEGLFEEGELLSSSRDHLLPEMPHSSPPPSKHMQEMPQPMP